MKVRDLKPGMLLKPRDGFTWRYQNSAYLDKIMCLTVVPCNTTACEEEVVMYVGERSSSPTTYGKQIVLWQGEKISVNPSAWRCIVQVT